MTDTQYFETLIEVKNNEPVTTSKHVATVFGKKHKNVMRKIEKLRTAQNGAVKNMFVRATYVSKQNKTIPMFYMNKDGFALLVMGFTGSLATTFKISFIKAFDAMQAKLTKFNNTPSYQIADPIKRAERWIQEAKQYKKLQSSYKKQTKIQHAFEASKRNVSVSHFAKMLKQNGIDMGRNRLFRWLRNNDYLMSSHIDRNVPYQQYVDQKLFRMTEYPIQKGDHRILVQVTRITPKGQQYFMKIFIDRKNHLDLVNKKLKKISFGGNK